MRMGFFLPTGASFYARKSLFTRGRVCVGADIVSLAGVVFYTREVLFRVCVCTGVGIVSRTHGGFLPTRLRVKAFLRVRVHALARIRPSRTHGVLYPRAWVCIRVGIYTRTYTRRVLHTCMCMHTCACVRLCVCMHVVPCVCVRMHKPCMCMHGCVYGCVYAYA